MELSSSRLLGIIGALFMVIGLIPTIGFLLMIVGIIFVLVAMKGYSDAYHEGSIFHNSLYTVVFIIIGFAVFIGVLFFGLMNLLASVGITNLTQLNSWQSINWQQVINTSNILQFVGAIILGLVVLFAFTVIASLYFRRALTTLGEKTGVKLFHTTGTVFFVGALLTIIFVGFIVIWVSLILLLVCFIESKPQVPMPQAQQQTPQ
ncbi:MAG TPA: DUF996 domain-containing protein [Candidatus Thermoplasmatota archaeon]|nr:DUF996 domain-containing protein [Candidatus Thermoplasmatota archaeon]